MNIFKAIFLLLSCFLILESVFYVNSWLYGMVGPITYDRGDSLCPSSPDGKCMEDAVKLAVEEVVAKAVQEGLNKAVTKAVVEGVAEFNPTHVPGGSSNAEVQMKECQRMKEEAAACEAEAISLDPALGEGAEGGPVVEEPTAEENQELVEQIEEDVAIQAEIEGEQMKESEAEAEAQLAASQADEPIVDAEPANAAAEETVVEGEEGEEKAEAGAEPVAAAA